MSLLLGIDTATIAVSAAITRDGTVLAHFSCAGARRQTETLHPAIDLVLTASGVAPGDLDGIVVDVGPGRFTGVRVGLAAAKALAFAAGVPVIGYLECRAAPRRGRGRGRRGRGGRPPPGRGGDVLLRRPGPRARPYDAGRARTDPCRPRRHRTDPRRRRGGRVLLGDRTGGRSGAPDHERSDRAFGARGPPARRAPRRARSIRSRSGDLPRAALTSGSAGRPGAGPPRPIRLEVG